VRSALPFPGYVRASKNIYSNLHAILAELSTFSAHSTMVVGRPGSHVPYALTFIFAFEIQKKINSLLFISLKKKKGRANSFSVIPSLIFAPL
jgi:hypothetical protein